MGVTYPQAHSRAAVAVGNIRTEPQAAAAAALGDIRKELEAAVAALRNTLQVVHVAVALGNTRTVPQAGQGLPGPGLARSRGGRSNPNARLEVGPGERL